MRAIFFLLLSCLGFRFLFSGNPGDSGEEHDVATPQHFRPLVLQLYPQGGLRVDKGEEEEEEKGEEEEEEKEEEAEDEGEEEEEEEENDNKKKKATTTTTTTTTKTTTTTTTTMTTTTSTTTTSGGKEAEFLFHLILSVVVWRAQSHLKAKVKRSKKKKKKFAIFPFRNSIQMRKHARLMSE